VLERALADVDLGWSEVKRKYAHNPNDLWADLFAGYAPIKPCLRMRLGMRGSAHAGATYDRPDRGGLGVESERPHRPGVRIYLVSQAEPRQVQFRDYLAY